MDRVSEGNLNKVLVAMRRNKLSDYHFNWNTGYGYDDSGREVTEKIFAEVLGKEDSIVRTQITSGTHALSLMLLGLIEPGQSIVSITGKPYDTLEATFGIKETKGINLKTIGAVYHQVDLINGEFDTYKISEVLKSSPDYVYIQRSPGYSWRRHFNVKEIDDMIYHIKNTSPKTVVLLDNCYGEFTEFAEPKADVVAGSLIKNLGGGIALSGGYVAGSAVLIEKIAERLTAPGIGKEIGLTFGQTRQMLQGLFLAPSVVAGAMKGALLMGEVFEQLGYKVAPKACDSAGHIIQAIELGSKEKLLKFCEAVQRISPVNSHVRPVPAPMPGYEDDVIMAAGAFVQGSSIEMSADGPVREPYNIYFQGGLCYEHVRIAIKEILEAVC
ncbi:methionine gamma-lyase family protein [Bacteroides heparinolyticus]|uniref:methionine gamma-lyase family protein n=1 Tax=Prevotella heparinolytica TaxID=28113 RepID=UPI00359F7F95